MKNKGFMLVETLIASTVILGALIFLYIQFSSIKRAYDNSFKYNTIPGLYNGKTLSNFLETHGYTKIDFEYNNTTNGYIQLTKNNCAVKYYDASSDIRLCEQVIESIEAKQILFVGNNITNLQNSLKSNNYDTNVFDENLKKFIIGLEPIEYSNKKRLIIEYSNNTCAVISIGADKS